MKPPMNLINVVIGIIMHLHLLDHLLKHLQII